MYVATKHFAPLQLEKKECVIATLSSSERLRTIAVYVVPRVYCKRRHGSLLIYGQT